MATNANRKIDACADSITAPEPGLTPEELIARAVALRPLLRESQVDCEKAGRVPEPVNAKLVEAGFFRIVQPRRFGGYEFDIPTYYRVMMELARGCTETGWVVSLVAGNPLLLAKYSEQAQREAYGVTGDYRCAGSYAPPGRAVPVEGGYRVTANWKNGSGCDISTHFMPLVMIERPEGMSPALILVDRDQFTIVDDWNVIGMRGTGSKQVVADNIFTPEHRVMPCAGMDRGAEPLNSICEISDNPMYSGIVSPFLLSQTAAVAVGTAWAALDHYEEILRTRKSPYPPYEEKYKDPTAQRNFGTAFRLATTAESALINAGVEFMEYARQAKAGTAPFDDARVMRLRAIAVQCVQLAWEAFDIVFQAGGTSSAARQGSPLERILRNFAVLRTHAVLQPEMTAGLVGRAHFGVVK